MNLHRPTFTVSFVWPFLPLLLAFTDATLKPAQAASTSVTVPIAGQQFGDGIEVHATSGAGRLLPATLYKYRVRGTCHGTGLLAFLVPNGTSINELIEKISPGGSSFLNGTYANPGGTFPITVINRVFSGDVPIPGLGGTAHFSLTVSGRVNKKGLVRFDVTNVNIDVPGLGFVGTIVFEDGSKLVVKTVQ